MGYRARFGDKIICVFMEIPQGNTREDIKAREKIIKDYYAQWIASHPDKQIWNESLKAFIKVKFVSINETYGHAARRYESTVAVFNLTEILSNAKLIAKRPKKYIQYCITVEDEIK